MAAAVAEIIARRVHHPGAASAQLPYRALESQLGIGRRQIERRFLGAVGLRPKQYARLLRIRRAATLMRGTSSLTEIAHALGYADQAHFTRDFRAVVGMAPRRVRRRQNPLVDAFADDPMSHSFKSAERPVRKMQT